MCKISHQKNGVLLAHECGKDRDGYGKTGDRGRYSRQGNEIVLRTPVYR